jgi:putative phosphoesterase
MLCGLIADTHNNQTNLKTAIKHFQEKGVETILHAGDITSVQTLRLLTGFDVWIAQGNMDRDPGLKTQARSLFGPGHFQPVLTIELAHTMVALLHSDLSPEYTNIVSSGFYRYVIYGHTHVPEDKTIGNTRIINPGSLSGARYTSPTCALLDLLTDTLTWLKL